MPSATNETTGVITMLLFSISGNEIGSADSLTIMELIFDIDALTPWAKKSL
jgi:hypothetical protein